MWWSSYTTGLDATEDTWIQKLGGPEPRGAVTPFILGPEGSLLGFFWHSHVMQRGPLLPPPEPSWSSLVNRAAALVGKTKLEPEIVVAVGNYRGVFRNLLGGRLGVAGVRVAAPDSSLRERPDALPSDVRDKLIATLGGAAALINPIAGLLVSAGDLGVTLLRRWQETPQPQLQPQMVLFDTLKAATASGPTVLLFEDITAPGRELIWQISLYHATRLPDRSLLVVVGADGPERLEQVNGDDSLVGYPPILKQVKAAVLANRASWCWFPPLSVARVAEWVGPVDDDVAERLIAVSGGNDDIAARRWDEWVESGHVSNVRGRWSTTGIDDPIERDLLEVLSNRLTEAAHATPALDVVGVARKALAAMLGLATEAASLLDIQKRVITDAIDASEGRLRFEEELGDLLWYVAAVAKANGFSLDELAAKNLARTQELWEEVTGDHDLRDLPVFDEGCPATERFPRRLEIEFREVENKFGRKVAQMTLLKAEPNAFPEGRTDRGLGAGGQPRWQGFALREVLGDPLGDNNRRVDGYRFHDAIHLGFLATLNWSATMRSLLHVKRGSDLDTDDAEDGARAIFSEEGLAAILSRLAPRRMGYRDRFNIDGETLQIVEASVDGLEVARLPHWAWRRAIIAGFTAMRSLDENGGGILVADLDERKLSFRSL
jgi:NTP pyrophosphatase (non-canonical NTP hydrolase)